MDRFSRNAQSTSNQNRRNPQPPPAFAPAFAVKRRREYDTEDEPFTYIKRSEHGDQASPADGLNPGPARSIGHTATNVWDWKSRTLRPLRFIDGELIAPEVDAQFIEDNQIMRDDYQPQNQFERANAAYLGRITSTKVVSEMGESRVETQLAAETRLALMDRYGNYTDGVNRGQVRQSLMGERNRRYEERDREMLRANKILREWQGLSSREKDERMEEHRRNVEQTLATLTLEEEEEKLETFTSSINDLTLRMSSRSSRRSTNTSRQSSTVDLSAHSVRSVTTGPNHGAERGLRSHASRYGRGNRTRRQTAESSTTRNSSVANESAQSDQLFLSSDELFVDTPVDSIRAQSPSARSTVTTTQTGSRTGRLGPSIDGAATAYDFPCWPKIIPIEDVTEGIPIETEHHVAYYHIRETSYTSPRVVSLALADEFARFTSALILDRLFGCTIQELQFFPEFRQAVAVFLQPDEAEAFVTHIKSAAAYSAHEYRRLQIAAEWYLGDANEGILPAQPGLLTRAMAAGASRTLRIRYIDKTIPKEVLFATLCMRLPDLHLVRAKLITPHLSKDRNALLSNSIIVEFSSIAQALRAKERFDADEVRDFEGKPATFLRDASVAQKAPARWCECMHCAAARELGYRAEDTGDAGWGAVGRAARGRPDADVGPAAQVRRERRELRGLEEYNAEEHAVAPRAATYAHDNVKSARPQPETDDAASEG